MQPLSPLRSASPLSRPKVTFHYPPSPLRERPSNLPQPSPREEHKLELTQPRAMAEGVSAEEEKCRHCWKQVDAP
jgi:hypothetical protein